jgi:peptide/nickel transport system permease protein
LRSLWRLVGWAGLGLVGLAASLSDFLARAPLGAEAVGPLLLPPSQAFPFGTDLLGRDLVSEVLRALSTTFARSLLATLIAIVVGGLFGFVAARLPRPTHSVFRWAAGVLSSVPALLLAILIIGIISRDLAALAAGLAAAPHAFVRAFDRAREDERTAHAAYARATGISAATLLRRDLVHEFRDNFLETAARAFAAVTITLATVSFLGFGATPPHRDLGLMVAAAKTSYLSAWWTAAFPALALVSLVLFARLAAGLDEGEQP